MDDLSQQINQILSDPQSMKQIQDMMGALGLGGQAGGPQGNGPQPGSQQVAPQPPPPAQNQSQGGLDPSALLGLLGAAPQAPANPGNPPAGNVLGGISPEMLQMASRIAPLLSQVNREDDSTRLLRALRPLLSPYRQQKLDEAVKILHMMRLLPLLKDSGMFSGLLSGLF